MSNVAALLGVVWTVAHLALAFACLVTLILQRKEPSSTIAWFFAITFLPVIGSVLYLAMGSDRMARRVKRRQLKSAYARSLLPSLVSNLASPFDPQCQVQTLRLLEPINPYPPTTGNRVSIIVDMARNFAEQLRAIENARHFVHLEYYIFRTDALGQRFAQAMKRAAARGVEVRFLFDAFGAYPLTSAFISDLKSAGIAVARHIPMNLFSRRWNFNFRNHRKILLVDGDVAFVGGANIGEEYLGRSATGHWFDMQLKVEGPAVAFLQRVFADDWVFASGIPLNHGKYFPEKVNIVGDIVSQVIVGGPDMDSAVFHEMFFSAICSASERVRLMTPFFVPTEPLRVALETAARRGIQIDIAVPAVSTKSFVKLASQSYYEEMMASGVRLFEYLPGFLHAKALTVDGKWSFVGTPNFDNRSFRLNFEVGMSLYDEEITAKLDDIFDDLLVQCKAVDLAVWRKRGVHRKVIENFARLFSPIL